MKKLFTLLFAIASATAYAEPTEVAPSVKTPTSFAVFIDRASYDRCREAVEAYRAAVQADGLGTYIICDDWQSPDEVRERILALASDKRMPLEGVVFVGDVPIAMLRDAQHLSSAFKMNQAADRKKSSIPSDRFYDDFDLKFDFIDRDADNPLYFYYSLRHDSAHHIRSDIYSARIKPVVREGVDKYEALSAYLRKAAAEHGAANRLDHMFVFCGHGYNSEAYDAWAGEQVALREQIPSMRRSGHRIACCTFETRFPMKRYLLQHLQDETLDIAICHHHGSPEVQYLNGYQDVSDARASIANVKRYLRSKTVGYDDAEKRIGDYMNSLDVPRSWFDMSDSTRMVDSLYNRELDIDLLDIYEAEPAARFVMFDACFNGSFHLDEYVAGAYIFGRGKTVVAMANSVNSLQDKWPDRYIGLLACGVRVGQWARGTFYLESHIIGDPTLRFENAESVGGFNEAMTLRARDDKYWLNTLRKSDYPDIQAYALRLDVPRVALRHGAHGVSQAAQRQACARVRGAAARRVERRLRVSAPHGRQLHGPLRRRRVDSRRRRGRGERLHIEPRHLPHHRRPHAVRSRQDRGRDLAPFRSAARSRVRREQRGGLSRPRGARREVAAT